MRLRALRPQLNRDPLGSNREEQLAALLDVLGRLFRRPPPFPESSRGSLTDVPTYVERLLRSPDDTATLVIQVVGAEAFLQFTGGPSGVEMDFPLITPAQRTRERAIRQFFDVRKIHVRSTFGSDGAGFLDIDLPPDSGLVAKLTDAVFREVFGVSQTVELEFMGQRLGVAA